MIVEQSNSKNWEFGVVSESWPIIYQSQRYWENWRNSSEGMNGSILLSFLLNE